MGERKLSGKPIDMREADFKRDVNGFTRYPEAMRTEFIDYWKEPDRAPQPKMRFEKEKTWSTNLRLSRWARNAFNTPKGNQTPVIHIETKRPVKEPTNEIEAIDQLLDRFSKNPSAVTIENLITWKGLQAAYEAIKKHKLWDPSLTKGELIGMEELRLKAYVIYRTLNYYGIQGWTFSNTLKARLCR